MQSRKEKHHQRTHNHMQWKGQKLQSRKKIRIWFN